MGEEALDHLNEFQKEAVKNTEGHLLLVAGAGSGKTRVITEKIKFLVNVKEVKPYHILAITFTNKAAGEMRERLTDMGVEGAWISTFHSMCSRILRKEAQHLGFDENFSIYDTEDQVSVIRSCLKEYELDPGEWQPRQILAKISHFKNNGIDVERAENLSVHYKERYMAKLYARYETILRTNQAMDFDDLLLKTDYLFETHSMVKEKYQERFQFILVDEYQDTNHTQYALIRHLSGKSKGVTVTGDPDQSIYSWRGADIHNILNFEKDFKGARVIKLEDNYRSTNHILELSNQVIRHNTQRYPKDLKTTKEGGVMPILHYMNDAEDEARSIALSIAKKRAEGQNLNEVAVFYRTNAQSRSLEEGLNAYQIPYVIIGGVNFFERMEVKDLIAYLRFIHNPVDSISLMRIVNRPARGISETTKEKIRNYAEDNGMSCWNAMMSEEFIASLPKRAGDCVKMFNEMSADFFELSFSSPDILVERLIDDARIIQNYKNKKTGEEEDRIENIREFVSFVNEFCEKGGNVGLSQLLENIALVTEKRSDDKEGTPMVTLMTLHAAKGLEFPLVYFAGLDEGLLPHQRSLDSATTVALEEERRLCYVGITRAMEELHLYTAKQRYQYNKTKVYKESRFVSEMMGAHIAMERGGAVKKPKGMSFLKETPQGYAFKPMEGQRVRKGQAIKHVKHGKGVVLGVDGSGASEKAKVFFDKAGQRMVMLEFEKVEILS